MVDIKNLLEDDPIVPNCLVKNLGSPSSVSDVNRQPYGEICFWAKNERVNSVFLIPVGKSNLNLNTCSCAYSGQEMKWDDNFYYCDKNPLDYFMVTNSVSEGVIRLKLEEKLMNNKILISSSQLSGCTACVLYLRREGVILFYHVGGNRANYSLEEKNRDLLNAILSDLSDVYKNHNFNKYYAEETINNRILMETLNKIAFDVSIRNSNFHIVCQILLNKDCIKNDDIGKEYFEYSDFYRCIGLNSYMYRGCLIATNSNYFHVYHLTTSKNHICDFKLNFDRALLINTY